MKVNSIIKEKLDKLIGICEKHNVSKLYVFGSAASENFNPDSSDIDLLVELDPMEPLAKGETLMNLWSELEQLFNRKVDLLSDRPIRNPYFRKSVENTKQLIYDRHRQKVFV